MVLKKLIQAENPIIRWINTIMLSLITAGIIWSGTTLVNIREAITKQSEINVRYEIQFLDVKKTADENKILLNASIDRINVNDKRITLLEEKWPYLEKKTNFLENKFLK